MLPFATIASALFFITVASAQSDNPCQGLHLEFVNDYAGCSRYFSCLNSVAHPVQCPDNLWFNLNPLGCFPPNTHTCDICPRTGIRRIAADRSCTQYTFCINGVGVEGECDGGTKFSRAEGRCVLRENVECDYLVCPLTGTKIVADHTSCQHYVVCIDGEKITRRQCPENMLFDRVLGSCARSENVVCPLASVFSKFSHENVMNFGAIPTAPVALPTAPTVPTPKDEEDKNKEDGGDKVEEDKSQPETPPPAAKIVRNWPAGPVTCPATGVYIFGHHVVCSVSQVCTNGVLSTVGCSNGRHWSTISGQCEIPTRANCPHGGMSG